jgi:alkylresorcinol/alkylpyrone synthase
MSLTIFGLGTALPQFSMTQDEAAELAQQVYCQTPEQARLLSIIFRRAGVKTRHTVLPHQIALQWVNSPESAGELPTIASATAANGAAASATGSKTTTLGPTTQERMQYYSDEAPELAYRAAREALERSELAARSITHLVTVSCTGFAAPGVDVHLMSRLGLANTVERVNVGFMGCHGAINGLRVAHAIAGSNPQAKVLLCAVELCSLHYCFQWDPARFVGNAIFADGAAALVGGASEAEGEWRVTATGSCLLPDSIDAMSWTVGDHGFEMELSPRVPDLINQHLRPWLSGWLKERGLSIEQVASWAIHPGGPRILSAVEESLGIDSEATAVSREVLSECGNMSSPTVLFITDRMRQREAPRPCVALGFGPGLVAEVALFE